MQGEPRIIVLTFRATETEAALLRALAAAEGKSASALVRDAIAERAAAFRPKQADRKSSQR